MEEKCTLYDRDCIDCGECDICDMDPKKHCDNCGRCIDEVSEYRSVTIEDFMKQNVTKEQIEKISKRLKDKDNKQEEK